MTVEYVVQLRDSRIPCGADLEEAKRLADQKNGSVWQRSPEGWRPWPYIEQLPPGTEPISVKAASPVENQPVTFDGQPKCKSSGPRGQCHLPATNGDYCNKHFRKLFGHVFKRVDVGEYVCELCDQTFSCENNLACPGRETPAASQRETCSAVLPNGDRCRHHRHHGDLCGHHFRMFRAHQNDLIGAGKFRCKHCGRKFDTNSMDACPARSDQARAQEKQVENRKRVVEEVIARALAIKSLREEVQAAEQELQRIRGLLNEAERELEALLPAERC